MPFHELTPMHHLVAFGPIPKTLVSFRPHAFRLRWERHRWNFVAEGPRRDPSVHCVSVAHRSSSGNFSSSAAAWPTYSTSASAWAARCACGRGAHPSQRNVGLANAILQVCIHCLKSVRTPSGVIILLWTTASPWGLGLARTRPGRHPQPPLTPPARSASAGLPTAEPISRVHPAARRSTAKCRRPEAFARRRYIRCAPTARRTSLLLLPINSRERFATLPL